jgi:hypothetical protein
MYIQYRTLPAYLIPQAPRMISTRGYLYIQCTMQVRFRLSKIVPLLFNRIEFMYVVTKGSLYAQYKRVLLCSVLLAPPMFSSVDPPCVLYRKVPVRSVQQVPVRVCPCLFSTTGSLYIQSSKLPVCSVQLASCIFSRTGSLYLCMHVRCSILSTSETDKGIKVLPANSKRGRGYIFILNFKGTLS